MWNSNGCDNEFCWLGVTWRFIQVIEACNGKDLEEQKGIWQQDPTMENVGPKLKIGNEE